MKHLIVGIKGNIGGYYAGILKRLGQRVDGVDMEFSPSRYKRKHDSVLICTPPETHRAIISCLPTGMPIFCEKPLIVDRRAPLLWRVDDNQTFVSSNWLFCEHLNEAAKRGNLDLTVKYPSASKYWRWDLIHFWSWYAHKIGKPVKGRVKIVSNVAFLHLNEQTRKALMMDVFLWNGSPRKTVIGHGGNSSEIIHPSGRRSCDMHIKQLRHWVHSLQGKEKTINPISVALQHHRELGKLLEADLAGGRNALL